eukprot:scaffold10655_cov65-Phaeocystis_antarctica.AAC.2
MYAPLACNRVREAEPEDACGARLPAAVAALPAASAGLAALAGFVVAEDLLGVRARVQRRVGVSGACRFRRPAASYQASLAALLVIDASAPVASKVSESASFSIVTADPAGAGAGVAAGVAAVCSGASAGCSTVSSGTAAKV